MNKTFHFFIELIFWVLTFLSPVSGFGIIAGILYSAFDISFEVVLVILAIGSVFGILFAERIRRKHGCTNYWSRIFSTPDIDK